MFVEREVILEVEALQKRYANGTLAIQEISIDVRKGEFASIVGPSGAGKTTLLKTICALLAPTSGKVSLHGTVIEEPPPEMILVFQDYARSLFPWLTVMGNVIFPLKKRSDISKADKESLCREAIKAVGLERFANYYPWQLSGGMQQRVGLARAMALEPEIMLMDEPFGSLDAQTSELLQVELLKLWQFSKNTVIFVTHNLDEALLLADRILLIGARPSRVEEEIKVPFRRPRWTYDVRSEPEYPVLRRHLWTRVREMVSKSGTFPGVNVAPSVTAPMAGEEWTPRLAERS